MMREAGPGREPRAQCPPSTGLRRAGGRADSSAARPAALGARTALPRRPLPITRAIGKIRTLLAARGCAAPDRPGLRLVIATVTQGWRTGGKGEAFDLIFCRRQDDHELAEETDKASAECGGQALAADHCRSCLARAGPALVAAVSATASPLPPRLRDQPSPHRPEGPGGDSARPSACRFPRDDDNRRALYAVIRPVLRGPFFDVPRERLSRKPEAGSRKGWFRPAAHSDLCRPGALKSPAAGKHLPHAARGPGRSGPGGRRITPGRSCEAGRHGAAADAVGAAVRRGLARPRGAVRECERRHRDEGGRADRVGCGTFLA